MYKIYFPLFIIILLGCNSANIVQNEDEPHPNALAPIETLQYGQFVGEWECTVSNLQKDGEWKSTMATWTFKYILDGHAIQDYWVNPADLKTDPESNDYFGTNIRIYNPKEQKWQCAWVENGTNSMRAIWHSHEDENQNILLYDNSGNWLITFYNITPQTFDWKWGFKQADGSMKTMSKIIAKRLR